MEKQSLNIPGKKGNTPELTLTEVAESLGGKEPLDALIEMRSGGKELLKKIQEKSPQWVEQRFGGDTAKMEQELAKLEKINADKLKLLGAHKEFATEVREEGWGAWALRKVKDVVTYPIRHPFKTLGWVLLAAALVGGGLYMSGHLQSIASSPAAKTIMDFLKLSPGTSPSPMEGFNPIEGSPV